jgi:UDPglucose 6-dehydrogenase
LAIIDALTQAGASVTAYDPEAMPNVKNQIGDKIKFAENQYQALEGAAALIIATEWSEFRTPDFELMNQKLIGNKVVFDGRNLYDLATIFELGFSYFSIGRSNVQFL